MLRIGDTIFSLDILERKFKCNLPECLGNCCRYGDSGAPLTEEEAGILEKILPEIKPYLRPEGIMVIEENGTSVTDFENDRVTPLINDEECAYAVIDGNIFLCGIEKAWNEGKTEFQKPVSCHLFPVRIKQYSDFVAANYQELSICRSARECGVAEGVFIYQFLKMPLTRVFGEEVYDDLCVAAAELAKNNNSRTKKR